MQSRIFSRAYDYVPERCTRNNERHCVEQGAPITLIVVTVSRVRLGLLQVDRIRLTAMCRITSP